MHKKDKKKPKCGEGSAVGPVLAARALPLRCNKVLFKFCTGYA
jgi:hypothetical protein